MACRSVTVRLSWVGFGLVVVMSSLTASKKVLRALSLSLGGGGGFKYSCYGKECSVR